MMTVKTLKSAMQSVGYYKAEGQIAAYYSQDSDRGYGQWTGAGAAVLGLVGQADPEPFRAALEGHLPGGIIIVPPPGGAHRPGVDLTFSAPKSVSILGLAANGGDRRLIEAHDQAKTVALAWVEREHLHARKGKGGAKKERTGTMVAVQFQHVTARPVNGVTDPQLHTHCVIVNATQRSNGKWVAANLGMSRDWIKAAGAVYRAELAIRVQAAGYEITPTRDGFEIAGITRKQVEMFSHRGQQVEEEIAKQGKTRATASASEKDRANLKTRQGKEAQDGAELRQDWADRAVGAGISRDTVSRARKPPTDPVIAAREAVESATRHLSERQSAFSRDAILSTALQSSVGRVTLIDVEKAINGSLVLIRRRDQYTTQEAVDRETRIIDRIHAGQNALAPISAGATLPDSLNPSQHAAARHILDTPDRFIAVQGAAGGGKTFTMKAVTEAARASGYAVVGLAPTHRAASELRDAGIQDVRTVASALYSREAIPAGALVIVDEAGMISAKDFDAVTRLIESAGARAVFIGDTRQLLSVEAGSPFRQMQNTTPTAAMDQIVRQTNDRLRETVQAFATGDAQRGAELARPYIHETESPNQEAAHAYLALPPDQRGGALVLTDTNMARREINAAIREGLRDEGIVRGPDIETRQLVNIDMTREQAKHAHSYEAGQIVTFQRDYQQRGVSEPVKRGVEYRVVEAHSAIVTLEPRFRLPDQPERIEWNPAQASKVQVAEERAIPLAVGDQLVFRETDREARIRNGDRATVFHVDTEHHRVHIALSEGRVLDIDTRAGGRIDYSYCQTVHASQGQTCDKVILAAHPDSPLADARQGYVALSRAREAAQVFTSDPERLIENWAEQGERQTAREVAGLDSQSTPARAEERMHQSNYSPFHDFQRNR